MFVFRKQSCAVSWSCTSESSMTQNCLLVVGHDYLRVHWKGLNGKMCVKCLQKERWIHFLLNPQSYEVHKEQVSVQCGFWSLFSCYLYLGGVVSQLVSFALVCIAHLHSCHIPLLSWLFLLWPFSWGSGISVFLFGRLWTWLLVRFLSSEEQLLLQGEIWLLPGNEPIWSLMLEDGLRSILAS